MAGTFPVGRAGATWEPSEIPAWEIERNCRTGLCVNLKINATAFELSWADHSTHLPHDRMILLPWDQPLSHEVQTVGS